MVEQETPSLAQNEFNANSTKLPAIQEEGDRKMKMVLVIVEGKWKVGGGSCGRGGRRDG